MKKNIFSFIMGLICTIVAVSPFDLEASSHEKTLGIGGGVATYNQSGYGKLYFQYSFIPIVRISPEIGYVFPHKDFSGFEASVDVHFPFRIAKGLKFYPLVGLTCDNWRHKEGDNFSRAGFNFGGGFDLYFTQSLKLSLQGKYSAVKDCGGGFFDLGIGYVF
ncbi:MAG: hypothetical protein K2K58_01525 [Muribaculaceae bacterium]|nr:hypothetical protein [Muribaculaceae bacterium]